MVGPTYFDFESIEQKKYFKTDSNIWKITKPSKLKFNSSYNGEYAILSDSNNYYAKDINASFQFKINLEFCEDQFYMHFFHKFDFELSKDGGVIETSYDNGLTWHNIVSDTLLIKYAEDIQGFYQNSSKIKSNNESPGYTGTVSEFSEVRLITECQGYKTNNIDTLLFRYTITSDSIESNNEGWILDNFILGYILVGIKDYQDTNIIIKPNPASDYISIILPNQLINSSEVLTMNGVILMKSNNCELDVSELPEGLYLIRINNKCVRKLMIK
jgi:hypothetical protein